MTTPPKPDHEKRPFRFKLEGPFLRVSTMLLITPISPNFKGLKCSVFGCFRALQSRNIYGAIDSKMPWQNTILPRPMFPCPSCAQRRPRITKSSGSCSRAQQRTCQKRPARLPAFSWGNAPQWPSFGAKPRNCKYSYGVSPGFPPGSFYPPRHAAQRRKGR